MNNEQKSQSTLPTSPDWNNAPYWVNWFAINKNGNGYWYSTKPTKDMSGFNWFNNDSISYYYAGRFDATNWQNSLQPRPTNP